MYNHSGTTDFLKLATVLGFVALAVWWMESRFGVSITGIALMAVSGAGLIGLGLLLAHLIQKSSLDALTKFNAQDAQIDRYRQQSFKALAQGEAAMQKAAARLTVLDANRVQRLASKEAKLLTDMERQKWEGQRTVDAEDWTYDDDGDGDYEEWR